jgi:hypothetical protein
MYLFLCNVYGSINIIVPYWSVSEVSDENDLLLEMTYLGLLKYLKLKLICDRRSAGQCVFVSGSCLELMTRFFFSGWQLRVSWCSAPSLTRDGSVIYSYNCFWALPEQLLWGPCPEELVTIFYCLIWDSPNLEGQVPVFTATGNRMAQFWST